VTVLRLRWGSDKFGTQMKNYSIVRIGNEYVVRAGDNSVLKVSSRRRAVQLVTDAAELLNSPPPLQTDAEPLIAVDPEVIPDPRVILDPEVTPDPV
jgi:hypothetical protein